MATKTAIEFVFNSDQMMSICKPGQDILITSYLEEVITQGGLPVGAMRVMAKSIPAHPDTVKKSAGGGGGTIFGCPIPPCAPE